MRKILGLVLVCALVFTAFNAYAEVQNLKVSGDVNASAITRDLTLGAPASGAKSTESAIASFARVRFDTDLTDNVVATVRLLNERYWGNETENSGTTRDNNSDISLDLASVTLKEFLFSPMTLTVGRQELRFGNAMIIGDVDTNNMATTASPLGGAGGENNADLSLRKAFDAILLSMDYSPLKLDFVGAKITEATRTLNDDVSLYGANLGYAVNDDLFLEAYSFNKITSKAANATTSKKNTNINTVGTRVAAKLSENLSYQLEGAYQFGSIFNSNTGNSSDRRAYAIESALALGLPNTSYTPSLSLLYAYFSGNKGSNKNYTAWDPMFEDQRFGDIANSQFNQSNAHIAGFIGTLKPMEDVSLAAEYYMFWWDKVYNVNQTITSVRGNSLVMTNKKFAGSELDIKADYDYTEDVQFSLLGGLFFPGGAFDKANDRTASEVIGSMKVSF